MSIVDHDPNLEDYNGHKKSSTQVEVHTCTHAHTHTQKYIAYTGIPNLLPNCMLDSCTCTCIWIEVMYPVYKIYAG